MLVRYGNNNKNSLDGSWPRPRPRPRGLWPRPRPRPRGLWPRPRPRPRGLWPRPRPRPRGVVASLTSLGSIHVVFAGRELDATQSFVWSVIDGFTRGVVVFQEG